MKQMIALLTAMILLLTLPACGAQPARTARDREVFAMDTVMELRVYDSSDAVLDEMDAALAALSRELNAEDDNGGLYALNRAGGGENAAIADLVRRAAALSARTGGALDVSLHLASLAWGFPSKRYSIPTEADLTELANHCGMRLVGCAGDRITLQNGAELDLGAIAKGYAADCCRAILERAGVSGILSLGGNIQTVGKKPDGTDWTVAIQDPDDPGSYLLTMTVTGTKSVVTSGDYQRFFERDGARYCHILNPETLSPARNGLRMVTIVADEGFLADGLSTALFVMGLERGIEFWRAGNDFEAIWLTEDGTVTVTEGLEDRISYKNAEVVRR